MMVRRLRGGLNDGIGFEEVNNGPSSREIFDRKFWQPYGISESLRELGFPKAAQRFIYRGTTISMVMTDVSWAVDTENHSSDEWLPSSARC
jgi:hypothetical protein